MAGETMLSRLAKAKKQDEKPKPNYLQMKAAVSAQEARIRDEIARGGQSLNMTFRDPTAALDNRDVFEAATGMPFTSGEEDFGKLGNAGFAVAQGMMTPAYLQPGYQGPQTGMGRVADAAAGLGQLFQAGTGAGPMGGGATLLSQAAGDLPYAGTALGTMGGVKATRAAEAIPEGITAYHGSPHTFDKFSMDKIGTGEGAQAYGHGLYFAEGEQVAKKYRDDLTSMRTNAAQMELDRAGGSLDDAIATTRARIDSLKALPNGGGDPARQARQIAIQEEKLAEFNALKSGGRGVDENGKIINSGSMYQVRLNVKPDELLDWDRPLSEQPESIRTALKSAGAVGPKQSDWSATGGQTLQNMKTDPAFAADMRASGVKGIRYKDAGSRSGEGGTYNYVIFDDALVSILKRYGIPITAGAGGAAIVSGANMPPELAAQLGPQS